MADRFGRNGWQDRLFHPAAESLAVIGKCVIPDAEGDPGSSAGRGAILVKRFGLRSRPRDDGREGHTAALKLSCASTVSKHEGVSSVRWSLLRDAADAAPQDKVESYQQTLGMRWSDA
jgi:hypothetical protein